MRKKGEMVKEKSLKEMQDEKFNWISRMKSGAHARSDKDVSISLIYRDKKRGSKQYSFTFHNNSSDRLGDAFEIAVYKGHLFFRKSEDGKGIRFLNIKNKPADTRYAALVFNKDTEALKNFVGNYDMKYDKLYELNYIEKVEGEEDEGNS